MQFLLFETSGRLYAIDTAQIREVAPMVELQPIFQGPAWIAGRMIYRGALVPVIDLARLLSGHPAPMLYSTRIVVIGGRDEPSRGFIAPKAVETLRIESSTLREPDIKLAALPYLGAELLHSRGVIQCLLLDRIPWVDVDARLEGETA